MKKDLVTYISVSSELIKEKIYFIRGKKVMLDRDLAMLYGVPTMRLNRAVRRNLRRFPEDFMFELSRDEMNDLLPALRFAAYGVSFLGMRIQKRRSRFGTSFFPCHSMYFLI